MSARGFALLAVLWTLTAVTALTGAALAVARLGSTTTRNRVLLARSEWAREACGEILEARYAQDAAVRRVDSVDLGRGTWCTATLEDPSAKLNLNVADRPALVTVLQTVVRRRPAVDSLVDALLDWRDPDTLPRPFGDESPANRNGPLADVWELRLVRGYTEPLVAHLARFLTTRGSGAINVNAAPPEVLGTLPGLTDEAVRVLLMHRRDEPLPTADALAGLLSLNARTTLFASYPEFVRTAVFTAPQLVATVTGGVHGTPLTARVTLTLVPVAGRLAVIRRETE
ncbi:MAG TPA: type II secretion system protein GspK [Gemmatimonadales bacterium]|nr:type II secretion system protein GspK [Gemmatimonadales bacterium]